MHDFETGTGKIILGFGGNKSISVYVSGIAGELPRHLADALATADARENPNRLSTHIIQYFTNLADGEDYEAAMAVGRASSDVDFERPCRVINIAMTVSDETRITLAKSMHQYMDDPLKDNDGVQYWSYDEWVEEFGDET